MSSISTFGAFTTARLGIYVSQKALDVTGNNIANINTVGYTRQSFNQKSMYAGAADRYSTILDARVGNGAIITNITQLRDPYLDIRYRNENASVGAMEAKLNGLQQLSDILDEVGKGDEDSGVLEAAFNNLMTQLQNLNTQGAGVDTFDTQVRAASQSLVDKFHSYASQLDTLMKNQRTGFDQDVTNVNTILSNIRDLNESIFNSNIYGGDALEQKDQRNNLIDELSQYMRIDVTYEMVDIGEGKKVEKLVIKLAGNDPGDDANKATLVDGNYATQLSIQQVPAVDEKGDPIYKTDEDGNQVLDENNDPIQDTMDDPFLRMQLAQLVDNQGRLLRARKTKIETMMDGNDPPAAIQIAAAADGLTPEQAQQKLKDMIAADTTGKLYPTEDRDPDDKSGMYKSFKYQAVQTKAGDWVIQQTTETFSDEVKLDDNTLYGALQSERELLTEQGEYATQAQLDLDPDAAIKRGIPYYQKALDTLANEFAHIFNEANQYNEDQVYPREYSWDCIIRMPDGSYAQLATEEKDGKLYFMQNGNTLTKEQLLVAADGKLTPEQKAALLPRADGAAGSGDYLPIDEDEHDPKFDESRIYDPATPNGVPNYNDAIRLEDGSCVLLETEEIDGKLYLKQQPGGPLDPEDLLVDTETGKLSPEQMQALLPDGDNKGVYRKIEKDGPLFSNNGNFNETGKITAANISIAKDWADGKVRMLQSKDPNHPSTDNSNLSHFLNLMKTKHDFNPNGFDLDTKSHMEGKGDDSVFFTGSFQEMFTENMSATLATDYMTTTNMLDNYTTTANELYVERDSVSGVDLNDEAMNMIQYQKSYNAACRLMTTIDEMLDKLINGTGRAGL